MITMEKDNQSKNLLLFQNKGHFSSYKPNEKNELKIVRDKKRQGTEIIKNKKEYNKAVNLAKKFADRLFQMKKEIKRNEFFTKTDNTKELIKKKENKFLKKVGTDLKNSIIIQIKNKNDFKFLKQNSANNNLKLSNIRKSDISKKSKKTGLFNTEINLLNINESLDDISSSKLLDKNKNFLELLNEPKDKKDEKEKENIKNNKYRKIMRRGLLYDSYDDEEELEDQIDKDYFYINPNSIFIIILDTLIFLITFYYLLYNPYYFSSNTKYYAPNKFYFHEILNIIMECIFIFDFLLQFIRAYYDFDENLIKNNKKIFFNYINSWFFFDLICILPFFTLLKLHQKELFDYEFKSTCRYYCQENNILYLLTFLKMFKIIKLISRNQNKFIALLENNLSNIKFFNDWGSLFFQIILSIIFLHVTACIHIFIGRNSYPNWIIENNISEDNYTTIYISSIYFLIATITSVGYGDISGYSRNEHIFQIFLLNIGIIAYSWLVSSISNYVRENNKDMTYFLSKVQILEEIRMSHPEMDNELYHKIFLYLKTLKLIHKAKDKDQLFETLPYNLKYSILYEINKPLIEGLNFFKNFRNSSFILNAVSKLVPIIAYQGDIVIEQNEIINSMLFVKQGRLSVELAVDMNEIQNKINDYISGDFIIKSEEENSDNDNNDKNANKNTIIKNYEYKRNNTISLMTTFNFSSGSFDTNNGSKPVSFKKRMQQFLKKKKYSKDFEQFRSIKPKKMKYIKLYYIRKGEQYGEIPMFLNKPSSFTVRVRSPKAELLFLKKIDAVEISSNYPNIWKRANKKSFKNFVHLKQLVSRELVKFCDNNGIKYDKNFNKSMKHVNSTPMDNNVQNKNDNELTIIKNMLVNGLNKIAKNEKEEKDKIMEKKDKKVNNIKNKILENNTKNDEIKKSTPFKDFEINDEIYDGELFFDKNNNLTNIYNTSTNANTNPINQKMKDYSFNTINSTKLEEDIFDNNDKKKTNDKKDLIKLIDSSRTKSSKKLYYHKSKKPLFKNNNYNVQYNINNSFNIQSVQKNTFNKNNLTIITTSSFQIKKIYENLNQISKGKYSKDLEFQNKIRKMCENKFDKTKRVNFNANIDTSSKKLRINKRKSFFQRYSSQFSVRDFEKIKEVTIKRKGSFDKINEDGKNKKVQYHKSDLMLDQITKNIIDLDNNLNNPEIFYNEMFKNLVVSSKPGSPKFKNKSRSTKKHSRINNFSSLKKPLIISEKKVNT